MGNSLPSSVQVFQHFYELPASVASGSSRFVTPEEIFNYFDLSDFLDFVTSKRVDDSLDPYRLKDRARYVYQSSGDIEDLAFKLEDGGIFSVTGAAARRVGNNAVLCLVGGMKAKDGPVVSGELSAVGRGAKSTIVAPLKTDVRPVFVPGTQLQRFVLGCRLNLGRLAPTISSRYLCFDTDKAWQAYTDDRSLLDSAFPDDKHGLLQSNQARLDELDILFQVAMLFLNVPAYFDYRVSWICEDRMKNPNPKAGKQKKQPDSASDDRAVKYVTVSSIRRIYVAGEELEGDPGRTYTPPAFQVEVSGFWRRLPEPWQVGKNQLGEPIQGVTWVSQHVRHKDKPAQPQRAKIVYVKQQVKAAEEFVRSRSADGSD